MQRINLYEYKDGYRTGWVGWFDLDTAKLIATIKWADTSGMSLYKTKKGQLVVKEFDSVSKPVWRLAKTVYEIAEILAGTQDKTYNYELQRILDSYEM